ncbi:PREDICTED: uncharacterized protein LOC105953569 [Erythranthe guttata]|uniref:uncharacterized protein LOC105953569 n=1 Tax=Erythranthe guttata TaxID=4155 RepID=UPI00064D7630|nr:PREDICTED: uncharacterized protein LOC105953569 [Erythranthe guttata]|eukprot:XP_012832697.1 PREDICTED: uncharacterized protein LOC105953569 [Erythranthe guttata]
MLEDDTIIKTIETIPYQELKGSRDLMLRVRRRDLYQFCNEYAVQRKNWRSTRKSLHKIDRVPMYPMHVLGKQCLFGHLRVTLAGEQKSYVRALVFQVGVISEAFMNFQWKTYGTSSCDTEELQVRENKGTTLKDMELQK